MNLSSKASTIHFLGNLIKGSTGYSKNTYKLWHARLLYLLEEKDKIQMIDREEIHFITWAVGSYWLYHPETGPVVPAPLWGRGGHAGGQCFLTKCFGAAECHSGWEQTDCPVHLNPIAPATSWAFPKGHMWASNTFSLFFPGCSPNAEILLCLGTCWDQWGLTFSTLITAKNVWTAVVSTGGEDTRGSSFAHALAVLTIYKHLRTALFSSSESSLYRRLVGSGQIHWESKQQNL